MRQRLFSLMTLAGLLLAACSSPAAPPAATSAPAKPAATSAPAAPAATTAPAAGAKPAATSAPANAGAGVNSGNSQAYEQQLYEAAKKEGKLVWWYTSPADEANIFIKAFTAKYPGVAVEYTDASLGEHVQKFTLEAQAKKVSVDVLGSEGFASLRNAGLLADMSEVLAATNAGPQSSTPDHQGIILTYSTDGVGYNKNLVSEGEAPRSWNDLLDPKWKGKVALDGRLDAFLELTDVPGYGGKRPGVWPEQQMVDFLSKLKEQNPRIMSSNTAMVTSLTAGEFALAVGVHLVSFRRVQEKGAPIEWAPLDMNIVDSPIQVVAKDAPHPNAARLFMYWSLSPDGVKTWDQARGQGDPTPGTGTSQSKYLEQRKITPYFTGVEREEEVPRLQKKYRQILGIPS